MAAKCCDCTSILSSCCSRRWEADDFCALSDLIRMVRMMTLVVGACNKVTLTHSTFAAGRLRGDRQNTSRPEKFVNGS
eukprot:Skav225804  [mRNA]  locus=scaffold5154:123659:136268:+ [translate_table: standard]